MTVFLFSGMLECPSDWTTAKAMEYVSEKLLSSQFERDHLTVQGISRTPPGQGHTLPDKQSR